MFSIFKVSGESMLPDFHDKSYVVINNMIKNFNLNNVVIFNHQKYGVLIKKLTKIDENKNYWFEGFNSLSLSSSKIGPIKKCQILGVVKCSIARSSIRFF